MKTFNKPNCVQAIAGFADYAKPGFCLQDRAQTLANDLMIIGEDDSGFCGLSCHCLGSGAASIPSLPPKPHPMGNPAANSLRKWLR
jgi:hypothetical protein